MGRPARCSRRRAPSYRASVLAALVSVSVLGACRGGTASLGRERPDTGVVRVASFDFAESELLAELFAQAIEGHGHPVERRFGLGSRELVQPALEAGLIDVVPEYVASSLEFVTSGTGRLGSASVAAERLRAELAARDIAVLAFARAVDRNAIAMRADRARELGVERISDLAPIGGRLRFVGPPECSERPACLPLLQQIYGIEFASFTPVPSGLSIALELEAGEADVGVMFTSDPLVVEHGLVLLEADRGVPRAENVVPLVRRPVLDGRPDLAEALETVTSRLTTAELVALNTRVARGDAVVDVAREWLAAVEREPA